MPTIPSGFKHPVSLGVSSVWVKSSCLQIVLQVFFKHLLKPQWTEIFRTVNMNISYMAQSEYTLKIMNLSTFRTTGAKPFHIAQKFNSAYGWCSSCSHGCYPAEHLEARSTGSGFSSHTVQPSLIKHLSSPKPEAQSGQFYCHRLVQRPPRFHVCSEQMSGDLVKPTMYFISEGFQRGFVKTDGKEEFQKDVNDNPEIAGP